MEREDGGRGAWRIARCSGAVWGVINGCKECDRIEPRVELEKGNEIYISCTPYIGYDVKL